MWGENHIMKSPACSPLKDGLCPAGNGELLGDNSREVTWSYANWVSSLCKMES